MLTEKDYCDYETCVALKEFGYVGSSRYYYTQRDHKFHYDAYNKFYTVRTADAMGYVLAIHLYEAQKWLRKKKQIEVVVLSRGMIGAPYYFQVYTEDYAIADDKDYASFEDALSEGIKEAVKIWKEK